ncbi:extensin-like [Lingula anatina]|uniref:Extensin-like n=1 Tax=Lingula anatina TaxID=7574 RepID=A0A1S3JMB9_LINAN|nr:extensin-like [Lingula anatina]|eukprot:XP_013411533.1 extensin-like [Lingula anatina]
MQCTSVVQHKPYPKANRKKQLQEQAAKYPRYTAPGDQVNPPTTKPKPPPLKAKPTLPQSEYHPLPFVVENLPSYSRPNFPTPSSHMQSPTSTNSYSSSSGKWKNLSTSPKTPPSVPSELSDNGMSIRSNPLAFSLEDDPPVA